MLNSIAVVYVHNCLVKLLFRKSSHMWQRTNFSSIFEPSFSLNTNGSETHVTSCLEICSQIQNSTNLPSYVSISRDKSAHNIWWITFFSIIYISYGADIGVTPENDLTFVFWSTAKITWTAKYFKWWTITTILKDLNSKQRLDSGVARRI